ncbi:MAG: hypothetical protein ACKPKO_53805, partial [Candidatus Fonsibacter sp.]
MGAKDLSQEEHDEISQRKQMGKTTTDEKLQTEKHYWQNFFLTNELDEAALKNFLYGTNPLQKLRRAHRRQEPRERGQPQV